MHVLSIGSTTSFLRRSISANDKDWRQAFWSAVNSIVAANVANEIGNQLSKHD